MDMFHDFLRITSLPFLFFLCDFKRKQKEKKKEIVLTVAPAAGQAKEIAVQCQVYEATLPDFFYCKI